MEKKVIETRSNRIWLGEDGIVRAIVIDQGEINYNDAKDIVSAQYIVTKEKKTPILVDLRNVKSVDREARVYFSSEKNLAITSAIGMLVNTPVSKMIGNLFLGINKPEIPTKLFSSEDKAIKWLKRYIE